MEKYLCVFRDSLGRGNTIEEAFDDLLEIVAYEDNIDSIKMSDIEFCEAVPVKVKLTIENE